jgi:sugar/nucleoside kinase (ribokinase family)
MQNAAHDVVAVGNAIVDVLAQIPESFLERHGIVRGAMTLIDEARADELTALFAESAVIAAGGSAANSVTGVASLGGRAAFIGKVADDDLGRRFAQETRAIGVTFQSAPRPAPPATARSIIAVTPDGQRSMNTFLGTSTLLEPADIDKGLIESGLITFLEGYLFDREEAKAAFVQAAEYARAAGRRVALTLSDLFCVERHRASFRHLVAGHVDILFANENEILSLYETRNLSDAIDAVAKDCPIVAVTRSGTGSMIAASGRVIRVAPKPVAKVVDTTGAGDLYAAGFLFGLARALPLERCGELGSIAAGEVISHMGPRPETSLKALAGV